jgi:hypothetical protein
MNPASFADRCDPQMEVAENLTQSAPKTLRGFLQLALESFDMLRYIVKLLFGKHSCLRNLMSRAIRSAHGGPDFHRNLPEPVLSGHVIPPVDAGAILYR